MSVEQYTYWSMTINNPDDNDLVLVRNPNEKYIRTLVYTHEQGVDGGTPHIQAYVRLFRNQTQTFMGKLFPRGHFKPCKKDVYELNTKNYAQKDDETTRSPHVHINNQIEVDAISVILQLIQKFRDQEYFIYERFLVKYSERPVEAYDDLRKHLLDYENEMVVAKPYLSKLFVSPMYERCLTRFWKQYFLYIEHNNACREDISIQEEDDSCSSGSSCGSLSPSPSS